MKRILIKIYVFVLTLSARLKDSIFFHLRIMSTMQTIKFIRNQRCSIARFGDGEFDMIMRPRNIGFQTYSPRLAEELEVVLSKDNPTLLICIPKCFNSTRGLNEQAKKYWLYWKGNNHYEYVAKLLRAKKGKFYKYGDALISRPYMDKKNKNTALKVFNELKKIWMDKDLLIVEGSQTRLGVGNNLFDNASSIKRIIVPAVNAFDSYTRIRETVVNYYKGELVLLALGPTATVLSADLANLHIQALDIGHIDIEYEWFLKGATEKIAVEGKYTNEVNDKKRIIKNCDDSQYLKQCIAHIDN